MTSNSNLNGALAVIASDIEDIEHGDDVVTVMLLGQAVADCGPGRDGQVILDVLDAYGEEPLLYGIDLVRDPRDDLGDHLRQSAHEFVAWLREHGVAAEEVDGWPVPPDVDQVTITATFESARWQPSAQAQARDE
jgi:hypothetical protein